MTDRGSVTSRRRRRAAWAAGLSLVLHALALTGMVVGLAVLKPPPEHRAVDVRLFPAFEPQPRPEPFHRSPPHGDAAAPSPRRADVQAPPESPSAAEPEASAPQSDIGAQAGAESKGMAPGFRGLLGCNDSAIRLTTEERRGCAQSLGRLARNGPQLALNISARKKAEYDKYERCLKLQQTAAVPSLDPNDPSSGAEVLPGGVVRSLGMGNPQGCLMGHW
jgi:hypothetical protein